VPDLANPLGLSAVERTCVLLVDGLWAGATRSVPDGSVPFLDVHLDGGRVVTAAFPTSTAVSITSLGTGLPPGEHGIMGYTMAVPDLYDGILGTLTWSTFPRGPDLRRRLPPEVVQAQPRLPERAIASGVDFVIVSSAGHEGSGLTRAAFRGARYVPIPDDEDAVARLAALRHALAGPAPLVVYTYYAGLDLAGHVSGVDSDAWRAELGAVDRLVRSIHDAMPPGSRLIVTGDHGMVDLRPGGEGRIDLAERPELARGVRLMAGDPRMRYVFTDDTGAVAARWREALGPMVTVLPGSEAIGMGLFGPIVLPHVKRRIGDLVVIAIDPGIGIFDSRLAPWESRLVGHHGGLAPDEVVVPLLMWDR
jgi:hypothetical protein